MSDLQTYQDKYSHLLPELPERARRLVVAADAKALGHGGITLVHKASGLSRVTIGKGVKEIEAGISLGSERQRHPGGGRKKLTEKDQTIAADLLSLVVDNAFGDPEKPLQWTLKSTRTLAGELAELDHPISHTKVGQLLKAHNFRLQSNGKQIDGSAPPDRDQQFDYINDQTKAFLTSGDPAIAVDTKKKELVGAFKNPGQTWLPKGQPLLVQVHDFPDKKLGKAVPYGIYDLAQNQGYVNVGINHDTAEFAVASIRRWWEKMGQANYKTSKRLLITADCGGSNGYRLRLWKQQLQTFADETGLAITVCHLPPGTSKWNKIEHRLFSFISINWKGRPLTSYQVIINLIASTRTQTGLKVYAVLDDRPYQLKRKVTDKQMEALQIEPHEFHGEWNYTFIPTNNG